MKHWAYVVEYWQDIAVFVMTSRPDATWLVRNLTPGLATALIATVTSLVVSTIINQERVGELQGHLDEIRARVNTNTEIILRHDEKIPRLQVDLNHAIHTHEVLAQQIADISHDGPGRCLVCHMTKSRSHPQPLP